LARPLGLRVLARVILKAGLSIVAGVAANLCQQRTRQRAGKGLLYRRQLVVVRHGTLKLPAAERD
jgi:hypothetical protein